MSGPAASPGRVGEGGGRLHIGTSGWHYRTWVGPFYPAGTPPRRFLPFYAQRFRTAEINRTFYRLPSRDALKAWHDATPPEFVFACKGSRFITHMKKLKDPADHVRRLFDAIEALGAKLGPVLFQLPPRWRADTGRLAAFLAALPPDRRYAFEFRDLSWFRPEIYRILAARGAALCAYDLAGFQSPREQTADFAYVRLHGPAGAYSGSYDDRALSTWAGRLLSWRGAGMDVYCYFDNDEEGYAARDALRLRGLAEEGGDDGDGAQR